MAPTSLQVLPLAVSIRSQYSMDDVKAGRINCIIVKDLSRFGRDYLETGNYIDTIFPFLGVRFISVNDHFDTVEDYYSEYQGVKWLYVQVTYKGVKYTGFVSERVMNKQ